MSLLDQKNPVVVTAVVTAVASPFAPVSTDVEKTYDDVPYDSHAFAQSHPLHLRSIAQLFGLAAPPVAGARVLELGCASGGNLLPMACRYPQAQFVGVDLSSKQIADGQADIAKLGIGNIVLEHRSIADLNAADGLFDYIICHGVYSWVPPTVQDAILRVCQSLLTPTGVAYVSYNTYPGWKGKEIVRDAMLYRAKKGDTPQAALAMAKGMVDFLAASAQLNSPLRQHMIDQQQLMKTAGDSYLQHEFLESYNAPCYFEQFVQRARAVGLDYLSEAEISTIYLSGLGGDLPQKLLNECGNDQVAIEQYMDYLRNRTFRQTLLVHRAQKSSICYQTPSQGWLALHYQGHYSAVPNIAHTFVCPKGAQSTLPAAWHKAVAAALTAASPATVSGVQLLRVAQSCDATASVEGLVQMLSQQVQSAALRFSCEPIALASGDTPLAPHNKPLAESYVRAHCVAFDGHTKAGQFSNAWHEHTYFATPYVRLLAQCDGNTALKELDNPNNLDLKLAYQYGLMVA